MTREEALELEYRIYYCLLNHEMKEAAYMAFDALRELVTPCNQKIDVVLCRECVAHNRCAAERVYQSENIAEPFCCRGKRVDHDDSYN